MLWVFIHNIEITSFRRSCDVMTSLRRQINIITTLCLRLPTKHFHGEEEENLSQLDARPTGDQEVASSTPAMSAKFFHGDLIVKYFLKSFSPFC